MIDGTLIPTFHYSNFPDFYLLCSSNNKTATPSSMLFSANKQRTVGPSAKARFLPELFVVRVRSPRSTPNSKPRIGERPVRRLTTAIQVC